MEWRGLESEVALRLEVRMWRILKGSISGKQLLGERAVG